MGREALSVCVVCSFSACGKVSLPKKMMSMQPVCSICMFVFSLENLAHVSLLLETNKDVYGYVGVHVKTSG